MSFVHLATTVSFPMSTGAFAPLAVGFFGLGTGYIIYGPQELFGFPKRDKGVDLATGIWGIWMPGFMQFLAGTYLFVALVWLGTLSAPPLYMAALAFTAYGVHWWAIGWSRAAGGNSKPNAFMSIAFMLISALGIVVFFHAHDAPVGWLFVGLTLIYISDFFASLGSATGLRALGLFHLLTGGLLMYLTWATVLNFASGFHLPL
ncbi:MAG: hypothetical protein ACRDMJ_00580 [Solirubrobacteraceae bacterium]